MTDSTTTPPPILDLNAPSCWVRRQQHASIKEVLRWQFSMELAIRSQEGKGSEEGGG